MQRYNEKNKGGDKVKEVEASTIPPKRSGDRVGNHSGAGSNSQSPTGDKRKRKSRHKGGSQHKKEKKGKAVYQAAANDIAAAQGAADARVEAAGERAGAREAELVQQLEGLEAQLERVRQVTRESVEPEDIMWTYEEGGFDLHAVLGAIMLTLAFCVFFLHAPFVLLQLALSFHIWSMIQCCMHLGLIWFIYMLLKATLRWIFDTLGVTTVFVFPSKVFWEIDAGKVENIRTTDDIRPPALSAVDMVYNDPKVVICRKVVVPRWIVLCDFIREHWRDWVLDEIVDFLTRRMHGRNSLIFEMDGFYAETARPYFVKEHSMRISWTIFAALRTHSLADLKANEADAELNINVAMKRVGYVNCDPAIIARHNYHYHTVKALASKLKAERQEAMRIHGSF